MTYVIPSRGSAARRYRRPPQGGLGGIFDDVLQVITGGADTLLVGPTQGTGIQAGADQCTTDAQASDTVQALDQRTNDIAATWQPTGFYSPAQVNQIVGQINIALGQAMIALALAPNTTSDATAMINQARSDISRKIADGQAYTAAAAQPGVTVVDAPGLKRWVTGALNAASQGLVTVQSLQCDRTWIASVMDGIVAVFDQAWQVVKAIAGVVKKASDLVVKVPDLIDTLLDIGKWAAILGGGYYVILQLKKYRTKK